MPRANVESILQAQSHTYNSMQSEMHNDIEKSMREATNAILALLRWQEQLLLSKGLERD